MWLTVRVLASVLLRHHPPTDALQASADLEVRGIANTLIRAHLRKCKECSGSVREASELLDLLRLPDTAADDFNQVRSQLMVAIDPALRERHFAFEDVRRLLGERGVQQLSEGRIRPECRQEIAALLGDRAAITLLRRISA